MDLKKFKNFCNSSKEYENFKLTNVENLALYKKFKPFVYCSSVLMLLWLGTFVIATFSFNIGDADMTTLRLLGVLGLVMGAACFLEMTIKLNGKEEFKRLFYTLFRTKKVIEKANAEKIAYQSIKLKYEKEKEFILTEANLSIVYENKELLSEEELEVFYSLYDELPKQDLDTQIKNRLSLHNTNTINNL